MKLKYLIVFLLTGCITPEEYAKHSTKIDRSEMVTCRTMCNKNAKMYSPLTGECECYPSK